PEKSGYVFDPTYREITIQAGDIGQQDFTAIISSAQCTIQGTVANSETHEPVSDAEIQCNPGSYTTSSGMSGSYAINLPPGTYTLRAAKQGFKEYQETVTLTQNETKTRDISLKPNEYLCPVELLLGGKTSTLDPIRNFRDRVLSQTERGRFYIRLFYRHAEEITGILTSDTALQTEGKKLLTAFLAHITTQDMALDHQLLKSSEQFFTRLHEKASPSLKKAVLLISEEMKRNRGLGGLIITCKK
ncbi:MAG: carboxypeptidase-like regulatory domain-containing protein, partial [Proteobacteria bacterium]|nr:carboxypeptidase-like regulatory domain-containing protein [Pseudomonadota bacterium]